VSIPLPSAGRLHPDAAAEHAARTARDNTLRALIYAESGRQRLAALIATRAEVANALESAITNAHTVFAREVAQIWTAEARTPEPRTTPTPHGPVSTAALGALVRRGQTLDRVTAAGRTRLADLDGQIARARAATADADATTTLRLVTA
jgi:hypothetical protein